MRLQNLPFLAVSAPKGRFYMVFGGKMSCEEYSKPDGSVVHGDGGGLPGTDVSSECNAPPDEPVDDHR